MPSASALVTKSQGRAFLFSLESIPLFAANSRATHTQSFFIASAKYFWQEYNCGQGKSMPFILNAIATISCRKILSSSLYLDLSY